MLFREFTPETSPNALAQSLAFANMARNLQRLKPRRERQHIRCAFLGRGVFRVEAQARRS